MSEVKNTVKVSIDGKQIEVDGNKTIIEVADANGIHIPRFCYHKKLTVAANCRMCLVEVEGGRKPMPACATPIAEGMKVFTQSAATLHSQKAVMEFLLINHPLDCPICDQGGQCELQDLALGFGHDKTEYTQTKRAVESDDLGPLIATEMTRCIHCTRCVRFGEEVAGFRELGATNRGEHMKIGTYIKHSMTSEVSGNVIELCPVGALLSKPFLYRARAWEVEAHPSIAPHDCLGSNIHVHTRRGEVMRVVPRENESINEMWLSDRDRFSYLGVDSEQRALKPQIKVDGQWKEVDWQTALNFAAKGLQDAYNSKGPEKIAALSSPSNTVEEHYLLQKIWRGLGSNNLDHRLRQLDFADQDQLPAYLGLDFALADLEKQQAILLVGSNIRHEQPLAGLRVRKAALDGAAVMAVNMLDHAFNFKLNEKIIAAPADFVPALQAILHALMKGQEVPDHVAKLVDGVAASEEAMRIAKQLTDAKDKVIVIGASAQTHPQSATVRRLLAAIANLSGAKLGFMTAGANSAGAHLAGMLPHRGPVAQVVKKRGLPGSAYWHHDMAAYLLMGVQPELDVADSAAALSALKKADFVVCVDTHVTDAMREYANVMLPMATFAETSGTYVNVEGRWQSFHGAVSPKGEARPAWKILRVLANIMHLDEFEYMNSEQVRDELHHLVEKHLSDTKHKVLLSQLSAVNLEIKPMKSPNGENQLASIYRTPIYSTDATVRHSDALQAVFANKMRGAAVNPATAEKLKLNQQVAITQGKTKNKLALQLDEAVPENCILIYTSSSDTVGLGEAFSMAEVK
jgi:NADH-quinone oxidoreductase subunit G